MRCFLAASLKFHGLLEELFGFGKTAQRRSCQSEITQGKRDIPEAFTRGVAKKRESILEHLFCLCIPPLVEKYIREIVQCSGVLFSFSLAQSFPDLHGFI